MHAVLQGPLWVFTTSKSFSYRLTDNIKHWGIFIHSQKNSGTFYHAVNRAGGWSLEVERTEGIYRSRPLVLLFRLGSVSSSTSTLCDSTLRNVPAKGEPSTRTSEAFTCRIWVKDAVVALHSAKIIVLTKSIGQYCEKIITNARELIYNNQQTILRGTSSHRQCHSRILLRRALVKLELWTNQGPRYHLDQTSRFLWIVST